MQKEIRIKKIRKKNKVKKEIILIRKKTPLISLWFSVKVFGGEFCPLVIGKGQYIITNESNLLNLPNLFSWIYNIVKNIKTTMFYLTFYTA